MLQTVGDFDTGRQFEALPFHSGENYSNALSVVHETLQPKTYLEIGTDTGNSLAKAQCASIAIDPQFRLDVDIISNKPSCFLFNVGSDDYFRRYDTKALLGDALDMAFLDGMHHFEYLLRDFINVEKYCRRNSVVFMHDCLPTDAHIARRYVQDNTLAEGAPRPSWWAGDVWKAARALKRNRPDLKIHAFDAQPTGLLAVTNLNPDNTVLSDNYFDIVEDAQSLPTNIETLQHHFEAMNIQSTSLLMDPIGVRSLFWI